MSNSNDEYWSVNGVSLNQYAWAVKTFGGSPRGLPLLRGSNFQVGYIPGQLWRPKFPDSRVVTLEMWTAAIDPVTDQPSANWRLQFNDNLKTLQRLFYNRQQQLSLTRQWYYTDPVSIQFPTGVPTMVKATALAEIAGNMLPNMTGRSRADLSVDLLLADPYFYGDPITSVFGRNSTTTVTNPGDDEAAFNSMSVTLYGPLQYPRLVNVTPNPDVWFQFNTVIAPGDHITFDMQNFIASRASDGANLSGIVTHSGTKRWMTLWPGANSLTLTSQSNADTGNGSISFVPPYV